MKHFIFFIWTGSSQLYINSMLHLRKFRQMSYRVLDPEVFVNGILGNQINHQKIGKV
eukprot:UN09743